MPYNSLPFLFLFFPCFFLGYFLFARTRFANIFLLLGSLGFLILAASPLQPGIIPRYVLLNLMVIVNYFISQRVEKQRDRVKGTPVWLVIGITFNVLFLVIMKFILFCQQIGSISPLLANLVMPGVSYIAFQAVAHLIDIHNEVTNSEKSIINFSIFLLMFPKLLAGPIVRYRDIASQLTNHPVSDQSTDGLRRFIIGLAKKCLIADQLARITVPFFHLSQPSFSVGLNWFALSAYTLQIYYDFSGYTDMAIGMAAMLGFRFPENFNRPYLALNLTDFWRRWHITLSSWFRDYVFLPLEFSRRRVKTGRVQINILIVFLLTGLWHGFNPTFLMWGAWHGLFMALESTRFGKWLKDLPVLFQRLYLLLSVMVGWIFFASPSLSFAGQMLVNLTGLHPVYAPPPFSETTPLPLIDPSVWLALVLAILLLLPWEQMRGLQVLIKRREHFLLIIARDALLCGLLLLALSAAASSIQVPSIYALF